MSSTPKTGRTPHPRPEATTFADLGTPASICAVLTEQGILEPFPIQASTLPDTLAGRDVLGRGRTGSGKTIAFAIPVAAVLSKSRVRRMPKSPRALVLVPTRELATQVANAMGPIAESLGLNTVTVFGGVSQSRQVSALRAGVDIMIACPGRLEDLMRQGHCNLSQVQITVLDEADHMADLGFLPGVKRLLDETPATGQRMLFSATLDNAIDVLVRRYLKNPAVHEVDSESSPIAEMTHHVFEVTRDDKPAVIRELASGTDRSLLFTRTKHTAAKLAKQLTDAGIPALDLHGNLAQGARERNLSAFASGQVKVLVATDIAARGIHVNDITLVVHVDPPAEHKAYLHRSGRTARAGAEGTVVTVMTPDQRGDVRGLTKRAGISPKITSVSPGATAITDLTGPPMAPVAPRATPEPRAATSRPPRRGPGRSNVTATSGPGRPGNKASRRPADKPFVEWGTRTESAARAEQPGRRPRTGRPAAPSRGDRSAGPRRTGR